MTETETLKDRLARVAAGSLHALLDALESQAPDAMKSQVLREAAQAVDELRHALGRATAERHAAQQRHAQLNREHEALAVQAELALQEQRDDLARAALARQLDIEAELPLLESQLAGLTRQERELSGMLNALLQRQRELQTAAVMPKGTSVPKPGSSPEAQLRELQALLREQQLAERLARLKGETLP
jgi:phage shock protein A